MSVPKAPGGRGGPPHRLDNPILWPQLRKLGGLVTRGSMGVSVGHALT